MVSEMARQAAAAVCTVPGHMDLLDHFARFEAAIRADQVERDAKRKKFPVLGSQGATVDFQLVADHGKQASENHYQTVERLAERGGLSWCELYAVLHNRKYQRMDDNDALIGCREVEARYLAAIRQKGSDHAG